MTSTPVRRLKSALTNIKRVDGIETRLVLRAGLGQPVNASSYLQLCARLGLDPMTGASIPITTIGELFLPSLGAALFMTRIQRSLTLRQSEKIARVSYSALWRIEKAHLVSIESVIAVCKWMGRHPFDFVSPVEVMGRAA